MYQKRLIIIQDDAHKTFMVTFNSGTFVVVVVDDDMMMMMMRQQKDSNPSVKKDFFMKSKMVPLWHH